MPPGEPPCEGQGPRADLRRPPRPAERKAHGGWAIRAANLRSMERIVLRVRLVSGESIDVTYEHRDTGSEDEAVDHVIATLSEPSGVLRCQHGGRLVALYARGVAAVEVAPRAAVL
jgi:hypothetical protein